MAIFTFTNRERSAGEKDSPLGRITGQMCSNLSNSNPSHRPFTLESFSPAFLTRLPTPSASGRLHPPLPLVPSRYTLSGTDVSILLCFLPWNGKGIHFVLCAVCASLSLPQRTATDRGLQWRTDRIITTALRTEWTGEGRAAEPTGAALQRDSTAPCAPTAAHGAPQGNGRARARPASLRVAPSPEAGPSAAALQRRRGPAARGSHPDGFPVPPHPRARTPTPTPFLGTRTAASPQQPGILLAASRRHPGGAALRARPSAQAQRLPARRGDAALPLGGRGREAGERSAARGGGRSGGCVPELATPWPRKPATAVRDKALRDRSPRTSPRGHLHPVLQDVIPEVAFCL